MKPRFSLKSLLLTLGITGLILGIYLRAIQPKPIRYLTVAELLRVMDAQNADVASCPPEVVGSEFELKQVILQNFNFQQSNSADLSYKLTDPEGVSYILSERAEFADKDRAHLAFLVRPESSQKCYWIVLKGPTWSELSRRRLTLHQWYSSEQSGSNFERRYLTRPL